MPRIVGVPTPRCDHASFGLHVCVCACACMHACMCAFKSVGILVLLEGIIRILGLSASLV